MFTGRQARVSPDNAIGDREFCHFIIRLYLSLNNTGIIFYTIPVYEVWFFNIFCAYDTVFSRVIDPKDRIGILVSFARFKCYRTMKKNQAGEVVFFFARSLQIVRCCRKKRHLNL